MKVLDLPKLSCRYQPTEQTWIYAMLPQNVSFLECFWRSHVYFIRYINKSTEITRNRFCDTFLENQKYLREMFLRRLRDFTEKTSFMRCARDVLKTSHKRHLFEMYLRRLKDVTKKTSLLRCFWEVSEISLSMEIWLRSLRDISCRLGLLQDF